MATHCMVRGNLSDGFEVVGPFDDRDQAIAYMESEAGRDDCHVLELFPPDPWFIEGYAKESAESPVTG